MGTKLLQLRLHEAKAFEAKALASASWFQNLKASASWLGKSFGFSFDFVTSQIQNFMFGYVVSKPEKTQHFSFSNHVSLYILSEFQHMASNQE